MKIKAYLISAIILSVLIIGGPGYAHGPGGGGGGGSSGMGGNGYGMMGGQSWMKRYGRELWDRLRGNPRENDQRLSQSNEEIESLRKQIKDKRQELASLFRSDNPDRDLISKKIEALNNLEQMLDEKISSKNHISIYHEKKNIRVFTELNSNNHNVACSLLYV